MLGLSAAFREQRIEQVALCAVKVQVGVVLHVLLHQLVKLVGRLELAWRNNLRFW